MPAGSTTDDCALAYDNHLLQAQGDIGLSLWRMQPNVQLKRRFDCAANQIVMAGNGMRALAVNDRDGYQYVTALALDSGAMRSLGKFALIWYSRSFDGATWWAADRQRVMQFDVTQSEPKIIWQITDLPGRLVQVTQGEYYVHMLFRLPVDELKPPLFELFTYAIEGNRLASRQQFTISPQTPIVSLEVNDGELLARAGAPSDNMRSGASSSWIIVREYANLPLHVPADIALALRPIAELVSVASVRRFYSVYCSEGDRLTVRIMGEDHARNLTERISLSLGPESSRPDEPQWWPVVRVTTGSGRKALAWDVYGRFALLDIDGSEIVLSGRIA